MRASYRDLAASKQTTSNVYALLSHTTDLTAILTPSDQHYASRRCLPIAWLPFQTIGRFDEDAGVIQVSATIICQAFNIVLLNKY